MYIEFARPLCGGRQHIVTVGSGEEASASYTSYREICDACAERRGVFAELDGSDIELPSDCGGFLDGVVAVLAFEVTELDGCVRVDCWKDVVDELAVKRFG